MRNLVSAASLLVVLTLLPGAARADGLPEKDEGTVALLGGFRLIPQHAFLSSVEQQGQSISQRQFQPQGTLYLGFAPDDELHITVGLGYGIDRYRISSGDLSVGSFTILLGADTPLIRRERWSIYGGGGLGYSLNTLTRGGVDTESNSTAGYLAVGLRYKLAESIALVVEDRYTLAAADYPPLNAQLNVGGNLFSVGLLFHFNSPDDKGHPQAPDE